MNRCGMIGKDDSKEILQPIIPTAAKALVCFFVLVFFWFLLFRSLYLWDWFNTGNDSLTIAGKAEKKWWN
jgi:hypothetical protein